MPLPTLFSPFAISLVLVAALAGGTEAHGSEPDMNSVWLARTEDEPITDVAAAILTKVYGSLGMQVNQVHAPGERALALANTGEAFGDVMHMEGIEKTYTNLLRIPVPLITFDAVAFTYRRPLQVTGWASVSNSHVCIRRGIKAIEAATAGFPHLQVLNSYESVFEMLKLGHCELAVLPSASILNAQRLRISGIRFHDVPLQSWPLYHYVHKSHADLVPGLTESLKALQANGYLAAQQQGLQKRITEANRANAE